MPKKTEQHEFEKKEPLIERQRKLWAISDQIQLSQHRNEPLPKWLEEWLVIALRKIAFGQDADEVLNIKPEKQGVRKDSLKREFDKKMVIGAIATSTQSEAPKNTTVAIDDVSQTLTLLKKSTARKTWNSKSTERKPHFSLGKK